MGNARPAERIVVVAALVLSIAAIVLQPFMESASCAGLMRWISVGGISVQPWVFAPCLFLLHGPISIQHPERKGTV